MCKLCWCSERGSLGEGRDWPLGSSGDVALAQLCCEAFPFFNSLAPGRLCWERGWGTGLQMNLPLAAEGGQRGERRLRETAPCAGCCGRWVTLQLSLRAPVSPPSRASTGTALTRGEDTNVFLKRKAAALGPFLFIWSGAACFCSKGGLHPPLAYGIHPCRKWGLSWNNQINPPNPICVLCCSLSHCLASV